ncbi:HEPN domain-containing protein [Kyrpidia tusciae]|uniref:HEPN domain protein n=1 Tax=Kyrpidia tusciae (strain DSM 2912 / NBRC 15312 / T2) TaxID=562970 RepID=D5WX00_KYRT2|nr:HEPN domain-containing protein [Kyrpidia tusciae]ADG05851.1 HEPN domain protein [Kyrpidia tusciae DSM 2912]
MKRDDLTQAYLQKAEVRLKALEFFRHHGAYSDVVREAQEMVELLLKAVLRAIGAEVPKIHDVGRALMMHKDQLPAAIVDKLDRLRLISKRLRKERELSFYGAEDFVPTEEYDDADARQAIEEATFVYETIRGAFDVADDPDTDGPPPHK